MGFQWNIFRHQPEQSGGGIRPDKKEYDVEWHDGAVHQYQSSRAVRARDGEITSFNSIVISLSSAKH